MKLNPTLLEIILAFLVSLSVYLWVKYGKRIKRWWKGGTSVTDDHAA